MSKSLNIGIWNKGGHWMKKVTKKLSELKVHLSDHNLDILIISEANVNQYDINNMKLGEYEIKRIQDGHNRLIVVHKNHLVITNVTTFNAIPTIILEIKLGFEKLTVIGMYREFQAWGEGKRTIKEEELVLDNHMKQIKKFLRHDKVFWGGDFNLNWNLTDNKTYERKKMLAKLVKTTTELGLKMIVNEDTRTVVQQNRKTSTLIDLVFIKGVKFKSCENFDGGSDHDIVVTKLAIKNPKEKQFTYSRDWSNFTKEKLIELARKVDWVKICWEQDIDKKVKLLVNEILDLYNKVAPLKKKLKKKKLAWKTKNLEQIIRTRNIKKKHCKQLYRSLKTVIKKQRDNLRAIRQNTVADPLTNIETEQLAELENKWEEYKRYDNYTRQEIKNGVYKATANNIRRNRTPATLYRELDKLENEREDSIPTLTWNNEVAVTDKEKAVMIHKAIEAKQKRVEKKLGNPKGDPMEILVNNIDKKDAFYIREFSEFEVYNAIKSVANKGSSGDDQISYVMLKYIKHFVSKPLLSIINQSIRTGYFPSDWKKTIVSPILKAGKDKTSPESYRPVSLLSALSRIMELMIAGEMDRYAEGSEILPDATHGYRKNRSTVTALLEVTSDIIEGYDTNQLLSFTALDISAGFDTVAPSYLLRTLELQGYSEQALKWFDSYLDSRCWRVKVNSHYSEWGTIPKGIPQGGPMSPLSLESSQ